MRRTSDEGREPDNQSFLNAAWGRFSANRSEKGFPQSIDPLVGSWLDDRAEERRLRFDFFSPEVVNDQGWLILSELYRAHLRGRSVTAEQVADAADLPISTVLRYAAHLESHDLVERDGDRPDSDLHLSEHGTRKLRSYFSKLVLRIGAN